MSSDYGDEDGSPLDFEQANVSRPLSRLCVRYGRPKARWLAVGLLASVVSHGAALVVPFVLGTTIDAVFNQQAAYALPLVPQSWLPTSAHGQFRLSATLVGGALVLSALSAWVRGFAMNYFAHDVMLDIRTDAYEKLTDLDMSFFDDAETGELMSILNNDTTNLELFLDNALRESVRIGVMVLGITGLLVYLNRQLAAITLAVVPLLAGFTWWFVRAVEPRYATWRTEVGNLNTRLENALSGSQLVKTATTEEYEREQVERVSQDLFDAAMDAIRLSVFYRPGMRLLTGLLLFVTFVVGGLWVFSGPPFPFGGELTVGDFVVFILLTQRLVTPLAQLSNIVDWYENAKASAARIGGLLDAPVGVRESPSATALESVDGRIEYDGVSFAYDDEQVLRDVTFGVEPGQKVAIVGPSGSGKSTAAKLLVRLYEADGGAVRVDGSEVGDVTLDSLRDAVGYVSQETFLFDGTIADNIRYGQFDASDQAVRDAARAAEAHEFIESLPDGYETQVGERGVKLSGGQRQRIALARVILQDPEILVLDEATASVDTETELSIQRSLDEITADRTAVVIAHRLSTVRDADEILVLDDGEIVERGDHDALLERDGLYATLWSVQAGRNVESPPDLAGP
ncbi:ABC transporter ATP-binding protein [Halorussus pelagicus]|uniref:ABC transporter ATP-binding protein n=1 Tax=Halorussus pelagicus TaxID=2505977 RepID=UPI000FFC290A|nr:ABC transporter ATP-binding protein [Halorussus pelagicus]